jgi:hypothetical protein
MSHLEGGVAASFYCCKRENLRHDVPPEGTNASFRAQEVEKRKRHAAASGIRVEAAENGAS